MRVWRELKHPNVVEFYGYTLGEDGTFSLISPWQKNGNVLQYVKSNPNVDRSKIVSSRALSRAMAYAIPKICEVAAGIKYLHCREFPIVHGDIKGVSVPVQDT
jgi:serine/threonine protein kinase